MFQGSKIYQYLLELVCLWLFRILFKIFFKTGLGEGAVAKVLAEQPGEPRFASTAHTSKAGYDGTCLQPPCPEDRSLEFIG